MLLSQVVGISILDTKRLPMLPSKTSSFLPGRWSCFLTDRRPCLSDWAGAPQVLIGRTLILLAVLGGPGGAVAQPEPFPSNLEAKTVEAEHRLYAENKTPREAHREAIQRAQAEAVRKAIGTQVQAERRASTIETGSEVISRFSEVVRTGSSGRVVSYEVLEERRPERGGEVYQHVRIRATVKPTMGRPDPGFSVNLRLTDEDQSFVARGRLEESDEVVAEIEASKDAHLTLFSVTPDTLEVIWPNSLSRDTFVEGGAVVQFPPPDLRTRGVHLRAEVPEGRRRVTERLVAVATKQKVPFEEVPGRQIASGALKTTQASVQAFNRWLVDIPLGQRAVASVTYDVVQADRQ